MEAPSPRLEEDEETVSSSTPSKYLEGERYLVDIDARELRDAIVTKLETAGAIVGCILCASVKAVITQPSGPTPSMVKKLRSKPNILVISSDWVNKCVELNEKVSTAGYLIEITNEQNPAGGPARRTEPRTPTRNQNAPVVMRALNQIPFP